MLSGQLQKKITYPYVEFIRITQAEDISLEVCNGGSEAREQG
jgi:hypothetical protein